MRKSLIAQSVAAVISGLGLVAAANAAVVGPNPANPVADGTGTVPVATQLVVNTDNLGHINIVPYYSVQNGNDTYINIVNTDTRNGKAVKVRFRGASNSDDVFDFTALLSPGDKFAFAVTQAADGKPQVIVPGDTTCTLGGRTGNGINAINNEKFEVKRLKPSLTDAQKATEASEGYVEILNMADIPPITAAGLFGTIKHKSVSGVWKAVCDQDILVATVGSNPVDYAQAQSRGLEVPTTGLMTNWTVINVNNALSFTGAAVAVEARTGLAGAAGVPGYGNIVLHAQNETSPVDAPAVLTADPVLRQAGFAYANYDFPDLSTPYLNGDLTAGVLTGVTASITQARRLSASLAKSSVANEFLTRKTLNAATDWIFSAPTRRYNAAMAYQNSLTSSTPASDTIVTTDFTQAPLTQGNFYKLPVAPATVDAAGAVSNLVKGAGGDEPAHQICVTGLSVQAASDSALVSGNRTGPGALDWDENAANKAANVPPFVISPSVPGTTPALKFCGETTVFKFNVDLADVSAIGAKVAVATIGTKASPLPFDAGWIRLSIPGLLGDVFTGTNNGLPIVGAAVTKLVNLKTGGNFGQTFEHRSTRP